MKAQVCAVFVVSLLLTSPPAAQAKGCIKGAVVGGVAGHYAGRHPIIGAIGDYVVGRHLAKAKAAKVATARQSGEPTPGSQTYSSGPGGPGYRGSLYQQGSSAPSYGAPVANPGYTGGAYSQGGQTPAHGAPISLAPSSYGQWPPAQATYTRTPYIQ